MYSELRSIFFLIFHEIQSAPEIQGFLFLPQNEGSFFFDCNNPLFWERRSNFYLSDTDWKLIESCVVTAEGKGQGHCMTFDHIVDELINHSFFVSITPSFSQSLKHFLSPSLSLSLAHSLSHTITPSINMPPSLSLTDWHSLTHLTTIENQYNPLFLS